MSDNYLIPMAQADVEICHKFVKPHYQPKNPALIMCVGATDSFEADAMRAFHKDLGYQPEGIKVCACDTLEVPESLAQRLRYDHKTYQRLKGDAKMSIPYMEALMNLSIPGRTKFDLVSIRNPDLRSSTNWAYIFQRAIQEIEDTGIVMSLIREWDVGSIPSLLEQLAEKGIIPLVNTETGIRMDQQSDEDIHHTLLLFKQNL